MSSRKMTEEQRERARIKSREWRLIPGNKDREQAAKAAWKEAHPVEWKERKAAASERYFIKHPEQRVIQNARQQAKRSRWRAFVISAYGSRCSCSGCHVTHAELLIVDHVNGDAHNRQNRRSTRDQYLQIIKAGFPYDFQLLCGSCNLAKSDQSACPLAGVSH